MGAGGAHCRSGPAPSLAQAFALRVENHPGPDPRRCGSNNASAKEFRASAVDTYLPYRTEDRPLARAAA